MSDKPKHQSVIEKSIERVYNLGPGTFESLRVTSSIKEVVEWENLTERTKKVQNWDKLLVRDFNNTVAAAKDSQNACEVALFYKDSSGNEHGVYLKSDQELDDHGLSNKGATSSETDAEFDTLE